MTQFDGPETPIPPPEDRYPPMSYEEWRLLHGDRQPRLRIPLEILVYGALLGFAAYEIITHAF